MALSSNRLGGLPLTQRIRVRVPVALQTAPVVQWNQNVGLRNLRWGFESSLGYKYLIKMQNGMKRKRTVVEKDDNSGKRNTVVAQLAE